MKKEKNLSAPAETVPCVAESQGDTAATERIFNLDDRRDLTALVAKHQVTKLFGDEEEIKLSIAVTAGLVAATKELLPAAEFAALLQLWEIDEFSLAEYLSVANGPEEQE